MDEGPRTKSSGNGRAQPADVNKSSTLACASSAVIDSRLVDFAKSENLQRYLLKGHGRNPHTGLLEANIKI